MRLPTPGDTDGRELALARLGPTALRLRRLVDDATATPIYISYRDAPEWFIGVTEAIDELEGQLQEAPRSVLLLAEHALDRLERAELDDSDGWLVQAIPRLERLHALACRCTELTGRPLASRLTALAAASSLDAFYDAADTHADALGDDGIAALMHPA